MQFDTNQIAEIIGAKTNLSSSRKISILLTDSRSLLKPDDTLFLALRTSSGDGHRFIPDLYARGVRTFVTDMNYELPAGMEEAEVLRVDSPLDALRSLGAYVRKRFNSPVVAITGSRGKTTVKEWIYSLLRTDYSIVRSPRSFNSQVGVPLSLWQLDPSVHDLAII